MEKAKPMFHGNDIAGAIKRAKSLKDGFVINSLKEGLTLNSPDVEFGYWSESGDVGFVRHWEKVVYPPTHVLYQKP